jgi:V8-like Glu-specific endopeptidase
MKKRTIAVLLALILLLVAVIPAAAITDGEFDGEDHPYVGLMVGFDATGGWRCSGTLISPTVFLTAGHCTYGAEDVQIWFTSDVESGIPGNGYPFTGEYSGTAHTIESYDPNMFFIHDVGVVVLDTPVVMDEYGALPEVDQLDALKTKRGKNGYPTFTAVGYGLQKINPVFYEGERIRMNAEPRLIQINVPGFTGDFSLLLSNNHSTGGTCFGDSGGPNFLGDSNVVAGVTSFGINGNCAGTGGVFRMDRADVLEFVNYYMP